MITKEDALREGSFRLQRAGFHPDAVKTYQTGKLPIDLNGQKDLQTAEMIGKLARFLEDQADVFVYGALTVGTKMGQGVAFLLITKDETKWSCPHEMYEGKYPYCFVSFPQDPEKSVDGYLQLENGRAKLIRVLSQNEQV